MAKQKYKITNLKTYNKAPSRGRPLRYSDLAITIVLVVKRFFRLTLRAAQGFIDSSFVMMGIPLRCTDYISVSKRAKSIDG